MELPQAVAGHGQAAPAVGALVSGQFDAEVGADVDLGVPRQPRSAAMCSKTAVRRSSAVPVRRLAGTAARPGGPPSPGAYLLSQTVSDAAACSPGTLSRCAQVITGLPPEYPVTTDLSGYAQTFRSSPEAVTSVKDCGSCLCWTQFCKASTSWFRPSSVTVSVGGAWPRPGKKNVCTNERVFATPYWS